MFEKSTIRQISALIPVYISNIIGGMECAWAATNLKYLCSPEFGVPLTHEQITIVPSLVHIGRMIGALSNTIVFSKSGRMVPIITASVLILISCLAVVISKSVAAVFISRITFGLAIGTSDAFELIYIGEISTKEVRGLFMTYFVEFFNIGLFLQYTLSYYLTYEEVATIMIVLAVIFLLSCYCLVESPYFLILNGNLDKASEVLIWLRAADKNSISRELEEIRDMDKLISYSEFIRHFTNPEVYMSFCIILSQSVIASTLINTSTFFANYIVPSTGKVTSSDFSVVFTCIPIFTTFVSTVFIDRFGRKILLMVSLSLDLFLNAVMTVLYLLEEKTIARVPYFSWIVFGVMVVYLLVFSMATFPPIMVLRTELFPPSYKVVGTNICIFLSAMTNFVWAIIFMMVIEIYGMYINFLICVVACFVGIVSLYYLVPETKGKTLSEIQRILKGK